ncbi:MAG: TAXI family TRAP transporter solute-binding subunit [Hyphomicrobiaceae bacterium]
MHHRSRHIPLSSTSILLAGAVFLAFVTLLAALLHQRPPSSITIAAGPPGGAYIAYAESYQRELAKRGVKLTIVETSGAAENLQMLATRAQGVQLAFHQGGLASDKPLDGLRSLGRYFLEPVWILRRKQSEGDQLGFLLGRRIAVGERGSGTSVLAQQLLAANGIDGRNSDLVEVGTTAGRAGLKDGSLDALVVVASVDAPLVMSLLLDRELELFSFARAESYVHRFQFLVRSTLFRGVIDLATDVPGKDVELLATTASVVIRDDLHPSLAHLLAEVLAKVHTKPSRMDRAGDFPKLSDPELEMAEEALRFHRHGSPFLQRNFSFWTAHFLERLIVIGLPALAIGLPLLKGLRALYCFAVRSRIREYHYAIRDVEAVAAGCRSAGEARSLLSRLDQIDNDPCSAPIPLEFMADAQIVHEHISRVRRDLALRA